MISGVSDIGSDQEPEPHRREAAGIYGLIVTASVFATAGSTLRTALLILAVVVTLVVYWLAEEYAEVIGHARAGHLPTVAMVRGSLGAKWPMVSESFVPLAVLVVVRLFGASAYSAAITALAVTMILLAWYGWSAGTAAGLHGRARLVMTALAASLGLLMILLKIVLVHLH
jgi:predicted membrane protein